MAAVRHNLPLGDWASMHGICILKPRESLNLEACCEVYLQLPAMTISNLKFSIVPFLIYTVMF